MMEYVRQLFDYNSWANDKIFEWSKMLDDEHLQKPLDFSEGSYIRILAHIIEAQDVWIRRIEGKIVEKFHFLDTLSLDKIYKFYNELKRKTDEFMNHLDENRLHMVITYTTTYNKTYENTVWQILFHILNHSTHHRSQLKLLLKEWGVKTENLDFTSYLRSR